MASINLVISIGGGGHLFDNNTSVELALFDNLVNNKIPPSRDFSKT